MCQKVELLLFFLAYLSMVVLGGAGVHTHLRLLEAVQDEGVAVVHGIGGISGNVYAVLEPPARIT